MYCTITVQELHNDYLFVCLFIFIHLFVYLCIEVHNDYLFVYLFIFCYIYIYTHTHTYIHIYTGHLVFTRTEGMQMLK
jgi:hypothetical protein